MCLFNTYIAQHVSVYLAVIRYIKIVGEIAALLYTVLLYAETCCTVDVLNKDIPSETIERFKKKFKFWILNFSVSCETAVNT
jgi:hypothetical protein